MKKSLLMIIAVAFLLIGCSNQQETNSTPTEAPTSTPTETPTTTEAPHEHTYTESITKEATCTEAGEKAFTCECGDTYTEQIEASGHSYEVVADSAINATCEADGKEADTKCSACADVVSGAVIPATGHSYVDYVYNNDATYEADGTETATCVCGLTDTRTASGTKLELPAEPNLYGMLFKEFGQKVPLYCMEDTDVYFEPSFQGPVIGHLAINDDLKVTGWANNYEANGNEDYPPFDKTEAPTDIYWYRIDCNGQTGYIPSSYVCKNKRDISITLNPLYANYPTVGGGGSGLFYPYEKEWRYVYGCNSRKTIYLHPQLSSVNIYDGIGQNVIATITDSSIKFEPTGNAYATYRDDVGSYYIYEIYYNGGIAYIDSLNAMRE